MKKTMSSIVIGIIAVSAIIFLMQCNGQGAEEAKLKATLGDMKTIGNSVEEYMSDNYFAPAVADGTGHVSDIKPMLEPFYAKNLPLNDAWGNPLVYVSGTPGTANAEFYSIISYGRDGKPTGIDPSKSGYKIQSIEDFDNDYCFSNGQFTYTARVK